MIPLKPEQEEEVRLAWNLKHEAGYEWTTESWGDLIRHGHFGSVQGFRSGYIAAKGWDKEEK